MKLRPSILNLFIDEKAKKKTENSLEKTKVLDKFFSKCVCPDWTWILRDKKRHKIKCNLKWNRPQEELQNQLRALNPNKSISPKDIHPKLFKKISSEISEPLHLILNKILRHRRYYLNLCCFLSTST